MIQISPRSFSATRSARRPDGSGNSLTQENPSERNSRAVPRAIASAVSDWRRSGGGTSSTLRTGDSMLPNIERAHRGANRFVFPAAVDGNRGRPLRISRRPLTAGEDEADPRGLPQYDRRPLVQKRRVLLPFGRDLHGRQWRRYRRLQRPAAPPGLLAGSWHHHDLADAVSTVARQGRWLRHLRLLRRRSSI